MKSLLSKDTPLIPCKTVGRSPSPPANSLQAAAPETNNSVLDRPKPPVTR